MAASLVLLADARDARHEQRALARALALEGTVEAVDSRGGHLTVRYRNPLVDRELVAEVDLWGDDLRLRPGEPVPLRVAPDDPAAVSVAGDRPPTYPDLPGAALLMAAPLGIWLLRRRALRRTAALVRSSRPTFVMFGALGAPGRLGRRSELHLYPLDTHPGARPVCTVSLVDPGEVPLGVAFPVEVKGTPAPLGRVVARVGDRVLWPAGRAQLAGGGLPRPAVVADPATFGLSAASGSAPAAPDGRPRRQGRGAPLAVAVITAAAVAVAVAVGSLSAAERNRRLEARSVPVVAEILRPAADAVLVRYREPGESRWRLGRAPAAVPSAYPVGWPYPARLGPGHPGELRLLRERDDVAGTIAAGCLPLLVVGMVGLRRRRWRRTQRRLAGAGRWRGAHAWVTAGGARPRVALGPTLGWPVCAVEVDRLELDRFGGRAGTTVEVAGDLVPGEAVALRITSSPMKVVGRARPATATDCVGVQPAEAAALAKLGDARGVDRLLEGIAEEGQWVPEVGRSQTHTPPVGNSRG